MVFSGDIPGMWSLTFRVRFRHVWKFKEIPIRFLRVHYKPSFQVVGPLVISGLRTVQSSKSR